MFSQSHFLLEKVSYYEKRTISLRVFLTETEGVVIYFVGNRTWDESESTSILGNINLFLYISETGLNHFRNRSESAVKLQ